MATHHADPRGEQLQVMQEGFRNLMSGEVEVVSSWAEALIYGLVKSSLEEQRPWKDILSTASIWYDYLSIPQLLEGHAGNFNEQDQANAITSIANYIDRCDYLFILAPPMMIMQEESGIGNNNRELPHSSAVKTKISETKDYNTWKGRGWCALELFAMAMKTGRAAMASARDRIIRVIKFVVNSTRSPRVRRGSS